MRNMCVVLCVLVMAGGTMAATWTVGPGGPPTYDYATIQAAINAGTTSDGDTIQVAAGTYTENVTVSKQVTIDGAGSDAAGTVITPPSGTGIAVGASGASSSDRLVVRDLRVTNAPANGINITAPNASYLTFDNVACVSNGSHGINTNPPTGSGSFFDLYLNGCNLSSNGSVGFRTATYVGINGLTIVDSHIDGNVMGLCFYSAVGSPLVTNVSVSGTTFNNNTSKGMYFENLDNAAFSNVTVSNSGTAGAWAAGVDVNLKSHTFQNISFTNAVVTNCGKGDAVNGAGLTIKARDDGSYAGNPASLNNVQITCSRITGCQDGLRLGEPGANNAGPTNVSIHNCTISGNVLKALRNESQALADAESNWWGTTDGSAIAAMISGGADYDAWLTKPPACAGGNVLYLDPTAASIYIKPGEQIVVDMNVANLLQKVNACQAMLGYASLYFADPTGATVQVSGSGPWDQVIWDSWVDSTGVPGEIDTAIGVNADGAVGTDADNTVCIITLTSRTGVEGATQMVFRPDGSTDVKQTFLSDMSGNAVWPAKIDSTNIVIDGTAPADVTISAAPAGWTSDASVTLTFSATDALAGIDHYEIQIDAGTFATQVSPYVLDVSAMSDGTHTATVKAFDKAGNEATASTSFYLDKTAPVAFKPVADPATWTNGDTIIITFSTTDATSGVDHYELAVDDGAFATVASPYTLSTAGLSDGSHIVKVVAVDLAGNRSVVDLIQSFGSGAVTTSGFAPWDSAVAHEYTSQTFDISDGGITLLAYGVDMSQVHYEGFMGWPPVPEDLGGVAKIGFRKTAGSQDNSLWYNIVSNMVNKGSWDNQSYHYSNSDGYRSYLFQGWFDPPGATGQQGAFGNSQYNAEKWMGGPANNDPECDTFDLRLDIVPVSPGDYQVSGFSRLHRASSRFYEGCPWDWNSTAWVPFYDGAWNDGGLDLSAVFPYIEISNWATTQTRYHTVRWNDIVVAQGDNGFVPIFVDKTAPLLSIDEASQDGEALLGTTRDAVQGTVNISVAASDATSGLRVQPAVTVTPNGGSAEAATYVNESPVGTFNYTWAVTTTTPNGAATITATVSDKAGNTATDTDTFVVDKNQAAVTVEFATLRAGATADPPSPADYTFTRVVTFVATDTTGAPLNTWTPTLSFTNNPGTQKASASCTLTNVPDGMAHLSAKTAWHLRTRLDVVLDPDGQATAAFTLLGGDLNESNSVNVLDYSLMKTSWGGGAAGDINGDGKSWTEDYSLMKSNWFQIGDPQ